MNPELGARFANALQRFVDSHVPIELNADSRITQRRKCNPQLLKLLTEIDSTLHQHDLVAMRTLYVQCVTPANVVNMTSLVNDVLLLVAPNVNTRDTFMSRTRTDVREKEGQDSQGRKDMCMSLILKPEWRRYKRRQAQLRLVEKNTSQIVVNFDDVQKAVTLMNSGTEMTGYISLLQLCCGARLIEVLHVSTFSLIPDDDTHVMVKGTAKSRTMKTFRRPLLFLKPKRFMQLVSTVQAHVAGECRRLNLLSRDQISKHFNKSVNNDLRGILSGFTSHRCRELYANASWSLRAPANISLTMWICKVLGHDPEFLNSALHYQGIHVYGMPNRVDCEPPVPPQVRSDPVTLLSTTKDIVSLERHNLLRDGQAQAYLDRRILEMQKKHVPITNANLRHLGFGGSTIQSYRQRQRSLKRSRDDRLEYVQVKDRDGALHPIAKKPKLRDGRTIQRIAEIHYELCSHNIEPTDRVMRSLGISARSLQQFRRQRDDAVDETQDTP